MNQSDTVSIANEIFQKKSLIEIRTIESKLRNQIREKKEELRHTVGEQYRNVIDSGENVNRMQTSCVSVKNTLHTLSERMKGNFRGVHGDDGRNGSGSEEFEYSQGLVQLYNTPSGIWNAIANGKYFKATILFVKSQQIISKFQLLEDNSEYAKSLYLTCPIIHDHAKLSNSLQSAVLSHTIKGLGRTQSPESLTENLIALQILRQCTTEEIFRDFLHSRSTALRNIFEIPDTGPPLTTRQQLTEISQLILSTLHDLKCVFFPSKSTNEILITLIKQKVILDENFSKILDLTEANVKFIQTEAKSWIANIEIELSPKIAESLVFVTNAKGLTSIRDFILESLNQFILGINADNPFPESHDFLKLLCIEVIGETKDIWEIFIGNPLLAKMENLISESLTEVVKRFSEVLAVSVDEIQSIDLCDLGNFEVNLANFLWSPSETADLKAINSQVIGFTSEIQRLCRVLDNLLKNSQTEIQNFITPNQTKTQKMTFSLPDSDRKITHLLSEKCSHTLSGIITLISEKIARLTDRYYELVRDSEKTQSILNSLTFLGRLGVNIRENCTVLESILSRDETDQWNVHKQQLLELTRPAFAPWIHEIATHTAKFLSTSLEEFCDISHLSLFTSDWTEIVIEEEREDGQRHETASSLPTKPSPILYQTLFIVSQEVHRLLVSDNSLLTQLADALITKYIEIYKKYIENTKKKFSVTKLPQNLARQLLFDVKWLLNVIPHTETQSGINRDINTILLLIEDCIDPFDLDVYKPYIHTAIYSQLQLNSVLFGSFTSLSRKQLPKQQQLTPKAPNFEIKTHNIVPLAPNVPRFILLPVSSAQKNDMQTKSKLANTKFDSSHSKINYLENELFFFADSVNA